MSEKRLIQQQIKVVQEVVVLRFVPINRNRHRLRNNNLRCSHTAENNLRSEYLSAIKESTLLSDKEISQIKITLS